MDMKYSLQGMLGMTPVSEETLVLIIVGNSENDICPNIVKMLIFAAHETILNH